MIWMAEGMGNRRWEIVEFEVVVDVPARLHGC